MLFDNVIVSIIIMKYSLKFAYLFNLINFNPFSNEFHTYIIYYVCSKIKKVKYCFYQNENTPEKMQ